MNDAAVWVPVPATFYWGWLVPLIFGTIFGWRYHRDKVAGLVLGTGHSDFAIFRQSVE